MNLRKVTDPNLLQQLVNEDKSSLRPVTDKNLLKQLNSSSESPVKKVPEEETLPESLFYALGRIPRDLIVNPIAKMIPKIPHYLSKGVSEAKSLPELFQNHPAHALGQAAAGTAEFIRGIGNIPHEMVKYAKDTLHLLPKELNSLGGSSSEKPHELNFPSPPDISSSLEKTFGQPKYKGEELLRNAFNLYGGFNALKATGAGKLLTTDRAIKKTILNTHDTLENKSVGGFKNVMEEAQKRGLPAVPVNSGVIESYKEYFPNTKASAKLIDSAKTGDYRALRKLQTDLFTRAKSNLKSPLEAEKMRGAEIMEKRQEINDAISDHLIKTGNPDLAEILNNSRKDFRKLQEVYYNPKINKAIIKLVDKDTRKTPKNLVGILQEDSKPMKDFINFHPELASKIKGNLLRKSITGKAIKYGLPASLGALGAYEGNKYLK